ncbi:hypothetical protein [Nitrosospira multiformis]|uniref:DUF3077 domain-containing protein n=1 Tax=Nitrosospira multiformis TaxID=1231 RepID=A0A1I7IXQ4_9PROT|nr:hypothetical protein [Nitrosospira multiformis]SFU77699.1 hypothetical protein SAMN05216417_1319 [Nitrosospira multiformis]
MSEIIKAFPANPTNSLIEAQDILFQATYTAEFLRGSICNAAGLDNGFELSPAEAYGFANVLQNLIESIKKASTILEECEREAQS